MKTIALVALCILAAPHVLYAQFTLTGTVIDQQTQEAVSGATIVAEGTGESAMTDEAGAFTISAVREFTRIIVTRIGYIRKEVQITDRSNPVRILLTPSTVQLTGVEVVGTTPQLSRAQSIGALTPKDLNRANGLSLENSINTIPGVFMQSRTPWGGAHITIRGYYPNFSQNFNGFGYQMFINNIPVTDATGSTIMDDIDLSSLGAVEIIKGPASSAYGSFIAGTINLTTMAARPGETAIDEQAIGGSYGLFRNNLVFQSADEASGIVVNYGHQTYDSFRPNSSSRKDFARVTGNFLAGTSHALSTYFSYNRSFEALAGEIDSVDFYNRLPIDNPVYASNNSFVQVESFRAGFTDTYHINDHFSNQSTLFGTGQATRQPFAHGLTDINRFSFGARTVFRYQHQLERVSLDGSLGASVQKTNFTSNGFNLNSQSPSDQENYGLNYYVFTEWTVGLPEQFAVTVGGSVSKNEFGIRNMLKNKIINDTTLLIVNSFKPTFTPRISVLKMFGDNISVYASLSTGYTPPALSNIIASNNSINLSLKPEWGTQYEIGTKGNVLNRKLSYQVAVFDLENTDKLVSQTVNTVTSTTNVGKVRNQGAELSLSYSAIDNSDEAISLLRPWASYTYSNFKYIEFKSDNNNNANTVDFSGNKVARVAPNVFNLGFDAATNFGLYLFASYQFVDKTPVTFNNSNYMKSYSLLNAKLGFQRRVCDCLSLDLFVGSDNLTGSTYYSFLFVGPNIKGLTWAKDGGTGDGYIIPAPYKATFYGGAKLSYTL